MKELDPSLYKKKVNNPDETVFEMVGAENGLGWGMAVADIGASQLHYHNRTREFYLIVEGRLEVFLDGQSHILSKGQGIEIPAGVRHKARSLREDRARIVAFTFPAWTFQDQHLVEGSI